MFDRAVCSKLRGVNGRANHIREDPDSPARARRGPDVVVFGQIARDLVLVVDTMPGARQSADVYQRRELLGGQGATQAVALAQGGGPQRAARLAAAAAGATVGHPGGRPSLTPKAVQDQLTLRAESTA